MTIDEKLELFYETAIEDATSQSTAMVEEYEKGIQDQLAEQKATLKDKSEALFHMESEQLLHEKNRVISLASKDVKKQVLEEEKSFEAILFQLVDERLQAYMQTDGYVDDLIRQVKEAEELIGDCEAIIYLNGSDQDKKDKVEKATGMKTTISEMDFIGGTRIVIREKNLLIDNSYLARRNEEQEAYTM